MKIKLMISAVLLLLAAGCGGGGGGGAVPPVQQPEVGRTITGVASKGLVSAGTVSAFRVDGGVKGAQLGQSNQTSSGGRYNITIPSTYSGPVLLEVSGGNYQDEVTSTTVPLSVTLRTAFNIVAGTTTVNSAITPLTEIAVRKMAGNVSNPDSVNAAVSSFYAVGDIITTEPIDLNNSAGATTNQKNYAQILAAVSQIYSDRKTIDSNTTLNNVLTDLVTENAGVFNTALTTYRTNHPAIAASVGSAPSIGSSAPSVTSQPANTSVAPGGSTTFSVVAIGTGLTYQWQVNSGSGFTNITNGGPYLGATTATLSITGATSGMSGYTYRVVVASTNGTQTFSDNATLTVASPTTAKLKLTLQNVPVGKSVSGLQLNFLLPAGVSITTDPNGLTNNSPNVTWIATTPEPNILFSDFNPTSHVVTIAILDASSSFGSGDLLQITAPISPGSVITTGSFPAEATIDIATDSTINNNPINGLKLPITVTLQ